MAKLLTAKVPFLNASEANFWTQLKTVIPAAPQFVAQIVVYQAETSACEIRTNTGVPGYVVPTATTSPQLEIGALSSGRGNEVDLAQIILYGSGAGSLHVSMMVA